MASALVTSSTWVRMLATAIELGEIGGGDVGRDDGRPVRGICARGGLADALRGSGDEGDLAGKSVWSRLWFPST
jgi:hypothetical protein